MFRLALDPKNIDEGETRLVARVDEVLPGQTITPAASQVRGATLVVAHLQVRRRSPPPEKDRNTRRDIKATTTHAEEDESDRVVTKTRRRGDKEYSFFDVTPYLPTLTSDL